MNRACRLATLLAEKVAQGVQDRVDEMVEEGSSCPLIVQLIAAMWKRPDSTDQVLQAQQQQNRALRELIATTATGLQKASWPSDPADPVANAFTGPPDAPNSVTSPAALGSFKGV